MLMTLKNLIPSLLRSMSNTRLCASVHNSLSGWQNISLHGVDIDIFSQYPSTFSNIYGLV